MATSLFVASSVFGQSCKPACEPCKPECCKPHELLQCPTNSAYLAPARIDIQCGWDVSVDAGFLYWQPIQENMLVGFDLNLADALGNLLIDHEHDMNWKYKPGFQVSLGYSADYDNWDFRAEYTWFHCIQRQFLDFPLANNQVIVPGFGFPPKERVNTEYDTADAKWRLKMDFLDVDAGRWAYHGTQLVIRPHAGARAAWIRQLLNITYINVGTLAPTIPASEQYNHRTSNSWAVGPRGGIDVDWNIGSGFRFFTNASADILFTRYNTLIYQVTTSNFPYFSQKTRHYNTLRTHLDAILGIGWSTYIDRHNWHIDLNAGYEFQVFFDQNMFIAFPYGGIATTLPHGNLYLHGLTAKVKLDF